MYVCFFPENRSKWSARKEDAIKIYLLLLSIIPVTNTYAEDTKITYTNVVGVIMEVRKNENKSNNNNCLVDKKKRL